MKDFVEGFVFTLAVMAWVAGSVIAAPGWLKLVAVLFPPYSWYLFVERAMLIANWLNLN